MGLTPSLSWMASSELPPFLPGGQAWPSETATWPGPEAVPRRQRRVKAKGEDIPIRREIKIIEDAIITYRGYSRPFRNEKHQIKITKIKFGGKVPVCK